MTMLPNSQRAAPPQPWHARRAKCDIVKLFSDDGLSSGTAALSIPYRGQHDCGLLRIPAEQLAEAERLIYAAGRAVAVHSSCASSRCQCAGCVPADVAGFTLKPAA